MATLEELRDLGAQLLQGSSVSRFLDSELLLARAAGLSRVDLISGSRRTVQPEIKEQFLQYIERRRRFEPVAYITGSREFWSLDFEVTPAVLIPRPETEILVDEGLKILSRLSDPLRILDLGTGSGCIAVAIACELKRMRRSFTVLATDTSSDSLRLAEKNACRHQVEDRIELRSSDWFSGLKASTESFHLIVSNPPYIALGDRNVSPENSFEPAQALYAGIDGLDAYRILFKEYPLYLESTGAFVFEAGSSQRDELKKLHASLHGTGREFADLIDLAGCFRGGIVHIDGTG